MIYERCRYRENSVDIICFDDGTLECPVSDSLLFLFGQHYNHHSKISVKGMSLC